MDTLSLRLRIMLSPRTLAWMLLIAGGGFFLISQYGETQVDKFSMGNPSWKPVEVMFKQLFAKRYSDIAGGWVISTIVFFWVLIGRQLKKAKSMMR